MLLLGVDIGGTNHSVAIVTDEGTIVEKIRRPTNAEGGRRWMLKQIEAGCLELLGRAPEKPVACGIGFGGPVDFPNQRIRRSMHVGGWSNFPLSAHLSNRLGLPTVMDNDANVAALGEHAFGAARGTRSMAYATVSTGIGGGLIVEGELYRGAQTFAGEFGHMPLLPDGPACACGKRGCVEACCSGTALGKALRAEVKAYPRAWRSVVAEAGGTGKLEAKIVFDAARRGHPAAKKLVERYCAMFGRAICGLLALMNPEKVVIGGGVSQAGDALFVPLRRAIRAQMPGYLPKQWQVVPAALGADSVLAGTTRLALRYTVRSSAFGCS